MPKSCPLRTHITPILWGILLLSLLAAGSGFWLRYHNEAQNQAVIVTVDYQEFLKTSGQAAIPMEKTLAKLKAAGVNNISIKELTARGLAAEGKVAIFTWEELMAPGEAWKKAPVAKIKALLSDGYVAPKAMLIVTEDEATRNLLQERLQTRFTDAELLAFTEADKHYFLLNVEVMPLEYEKNMAPVQDVVLGFDEKLMSKLKADGFNLILRTGLNVGSNREYISEFEPLIEKYDIKFLLPGNSILQGTPEDVDFMADLINRHQLLLGIIETPEQIGYIPQKGLDKLLDKIDYQVNRVFSSSSDDFVKQKEERYYRWVRSVVDRGIRVLYLRPFREAKISQAENLENTIEMIGDFHQTMLDKNYPLDQELPHPDARPLGSFTQLMILVSLLAAGCLYLHYLFRMRAPQLVPLFLLGLLIGSLLTFVIKADLVKVYALGAAILYPALSSLLLLIYLRDHQHTSLWPKMGMSLAILLGVNALGMYTIVSSLADVRFIMNIKAFSGIKIAFMVPLLLFLLNYISCFRTETSLGRSIYGFLKQKPDYLVMAGGLVLLLALYIYVGRSGNTSGITVSGLEIRLREILEHVFLARPRFKEIIIGYPALMAMVYLYHKYRQAPILLVTGIAVMMGSISMLNSFSHVFTAISISFNRTIAGLAVGLVAGLGLLLLIWIGEKIFHRLYGPY